MKKDKRIVRKAKGGETVRQVAAVPYRARDDGSLEVLVITSQQTQRFIVPKGWPMKGKSARKAAVIEAMEEAGIRGKADKAPIGFYKYWKRVSQEGFVRVAVTVFGVRVTEVMEDWPERSKRQRGWLAPKSAASLIDEPELSTLVAELGGTTARSGRV